MILIEIKNRRGRLYFLNTEGALVAQECTACSETYPICEYSKSNKKFGYHSVCKACDKKYKTEYQKTDRAKEIAKKNAQKHKESIVVYQRKYRKENKLKIDIEKKKWARNNRDKSNQRCRIYRNENKEKRAETVRNYSQNNRLKINAYKRERRKTKPETRNDWRIDRNLGHVKYFLKEVYKMKLEIREMNKGKSASDHSTIDHIIPLVNKDICGLNCPANFQILTRSENAFKNNRWDGTLDNESWRDAYLKSREQSND